MKFEEFKQCVKDSLDKYKLIRVYVYHWHCGGAWNAYIISDYAHFESILNWHKSRNLSLAIEEVSIFYCGRFDTDGLAQIFLAPDGTMLHFRYEEYWGEMTDLYNVDRTLFNEWRDKEILLTIGMKEIATTNMGEVDP